MQKVYVFTCAVLVEAEQCFVLFSSVYYCFFYLVCRLRQTWVRQLRLTFSLMTEKPLPLRRLVFWCYICLTSDAFGFKPWAHNRGNVQQVTGGCVYIFITEVFHSAGLGGFTQHAIPLVRYEEIPGIRSHVLLS